MPARNSSVRYGSVAQFLHWAIVVLLIVQVTLGKIADDLPVGLERLVVMARHKSFGITILGLAVVRLAWRWIDRPPPPLPMPRWQDIAARLNHWALYALLFALPLSGLADVVGRKPSGELVRPRRSCRTSSRPTPG